MLIFYKVSSIINFWKSLLLLATLYLLTLPSESTAQSINLRFESLTSENGLSQNSVRSIYQDSRQFLWFGTFDGLNRYDGFNFRIYKYDKDDPYSISGQVFSAIVEDKNGDLWIASEGNGLNRYNRLTDNFTRFLKIQNDTTSLADNRLKVLYVDKKGRLWVGTDNGLCRYDFQKNNFIRYNKILDTENHFQSQLIRAICEDSSGNIWIGTWLGLIRLNPETNEYKYYYSNASDPNSLSSSYIGSVYLDKENNIWLGTSEGLNKYDADSDNFTRYNIDYLSKSSDKNISDILQDNEGDIWLATNINGLIKFDPHTYTFTNFMHDKIDKGSLSSNILFSLFEDKTGIIWVGTDGGGVCKLNKRKSQFRYLSDNQIDNNSLSSDKVYSIIEDKKGIIWIGTYGGGLNRFDPNAKDKKITKFVYDPYNTNSLVDNRIRSLCEDDNGNIWIGTDNGVSRLNIAARKFKNYFAGDNSHLSGRTIFDIKKLRDGTIMIGTFGGGLDIYDKKNDQFISFNPDPNNKNSINSNLIWTIFQDSKNNIWVGTQGGGLNLFDINKKEFQHFVNDPNDPRTLSHNTVLTMIEDKDSNLWVGTNYGINKMIRGNDGLLSFENYTIKDGLPDNNIQSILFDDKGFMWVATNKGLSKFDKHKLTFVNFDVSDGLRSNEFFVHACDKRKSTGELMFGSNKGFNIFYPDEIKQDLFAPKVVITDFLLFNNHVQIGAQIDDEIILKKSITETKELTLSYKHNIISFEFAALHFAAR
jgi:ligand-binding sensor domain-containing protein